MCVCVIITKFRLGLQLSSSHSNKNNKIKQNFWNLMCLQFGVKEQEGKYFLYRTEKALALNTKLTSWLMESPLTHWGLGKSLGQQSVGLASMNPQFALHHHITGYNSTCLWSQHLGGRDRRIKSSRSYREIKLEGIWNLPPCWLAFIVPESIIQTAWGGWWEAPVIFTCYGCCKLYNQTAR